MKFDREHYALETNLVLFLLLLFLASAGWCWGSANSAKEMDILSEGQAGLLNARAELCLQRCTRRFHPERGQPEGHCHLWGLHLPVVSCLGWKIRHYDTKWTFITPAPHLLPSFLTHSHLPGATWACQQCVLTIWQLWRKYSPRASTCRRPQWSSPTPSGSGTTASLPLLVLEL